MNFKRFIAICGYPDAGKSTVQRIMQDRYKIVAIDDGAALRRGAMAMFGLSEQHVTTSEGKSAKVIIDGKEMTVRQILGDLGCALEDKFGENIVPALTLAGLGPIDKSVDIFSFGSVRKGQGAFYRERGGIVVEVVREGTRPSSDFDEYDRSVVDFTINNGTVDEPAAEQILVGQIDLVLERILNDRYEAVQQHQQMFLSSLPKVEIA